MKSYFQHVTYTHQTRNKTMQLVQLTLWLLCNSFFSLAEQAAGLETASNETAASESQFIDFDVAYNIIGKTTDFSNGLDFSMEEVATFNYSFANNEDSNVSVIAVAGSVVTSAEGYQVANITEQSIGPVPIAVNETVNFQAGIQLVLPEGSFYMLPVLYVMKDGKLMKIGIRPLLINVNPPPMSMFNPSFLSVQIILGLLIAGATYVVFTFSKPTSKKRRMKSATPISVDQSWLPDTYKK